MKQKKTNTSIVDKDTFIQKFQPNDSVIIYTDGACKFNPGPGGWGYLITQNGMELEGFGGSTKTTNNRMELTAVINSLSIFPAKTSIILYSDSNYVIQGITKWVPNWISHNWQKSDGGPVQNDDLWKKLYPLTQKHIIQWEWVKGHNKNIGNERVDRLAVAAIPSSQNNSKHVDSVLIPSDPILFENIPKFQFLLNITPQNPVRIDVATSISTQTNSFFKSVNGTWVSILSTGMVRTEINGQITYKSKEDLEFSGALEALLLIPNDINIFLFLSQETIKAYQSEKLDSNLILLYKKIENCHHISLKPNQKGCDILNYAYQISQNIVTNK